MAELCHAWLLMCHWKRGRFVEILDVKTSDKYDVLDVSYGIVLKNVRLTIGKDINLIVKHHQHSRNLMGKYVYPYIRISQL